MPLTALWRDGADAPQTDGPRLPRAVDVAVVGAGITGLAAALLLGRAGRSVAVLEARTVAGGTTGASTAKVSLLQGTTLATIARRHEATVARDYVDANREGQDWIAQFCERSEVPLERRDAVTFAITAPGEARARDELAAAQAAGLPVKWAGELDLPFPTRGGVVLGNQLQTDPVALAHALVREARRLGVSVHEGVRVQRVHGARPTALETDAGDLQADTVVIATGMPIVDRGAFFARMTAQRSYLLAFRGVPAPGSMFLSAEQPRHSLRQAQREGQELLLVGGAGHVTGRVRSEQHHLDQLRRWTARWWPGAEETHAWSAQDHTTAHRLPFAGPVLPGADHLLVAGGYAKWGLTNGVAAALALTARLTGERLDWAPIFEPWHRTEAAGLGSVLRSNADVALELASGWLRPSGGDGEGRSRVCTHLGGKVAWNDAEGSWDCPLHGSRFDTDGAVLEAPARCGLRRR